MLSSYSRENLLRSCFMDERECYCNMSSLGMAIKPTGVQLNEAIENSAMLIICTDESNIQNYPLFMSQEYENHFSVLAKRSGPKLFVEGAGTLVTLSKKSEWVRRYSKGRLLERTKGPEDL